MCIACLCLSLKGCTWEQERKGAHLVIFDALHGQVIAVVPESTPEHSDAICLQLLEHLTNMTRCCLSEPFKCIYCSKGQQANLNVEKCPRTHFSSIMAMNGTWWVGVNFAVNTFRCRTFLLPHMCSCAFPPSPVEHFRGCQLCPSAASL